MEQKWKQIIGAFLMGVLLPVVILDFGALLTTANSPQESLPQLQTQPTTEQIQPTEGLRPQITQISVLEDDTVVQMQLEHYIAGVVLAEMPVSFEHEALKAQAVAARTFVLRCQQDGDHHPDSSVCTDSTCCQAYMSENAFLSIGGTQAQLDTVSRAVQETAGEVLLYNGKLIEAVYFSCSGGWTEAAVSVWGGDVPYLQSVESPGEESAEVFTQTVYFAREEFSAQLGRKLSGSPNSWLGKVTYTDGGGVATMVIGGINYSGTQLRKLLKLNSTLFSMKADAAGISITTYGLGHRVGMSQYGANAMAKEGYTYGQILEHYYQGTIIDKIIPVE